ncbi:MULTISPECIES: EFR1 family ferrodoxin [Clostridium]|uniref:4Fe-4S dicluster domain-containing protein n=1 Tax=Clostridium cadaveris TaxID=1529 RepID=A0A1I2JW14_9CLOT|nr:EFR1 family ferrodoxin [Clostridium cadaveris]MDU4953538.1 EFR1 family ferrodoxin [Clostridium sp.]MDM8313528.1 EFR1 family ferrodoxin [Clostridium cadaveris]NME64333.1 4Fe-4S binding protein [Clostridium cadaveris]NWK12688.1 4Fe-4S binding protein [Clostridium cadaveris]PWL52877.1 MAG: 4Fe-4S dicluster domain-containing protein [Clostridium cadaveris]
MERRVWAIYFSATGTTEKVVKTIARELGNMIGAQVNEINYTLPHQRQKEYEFNENDIVIFGSPVYAGRIPNILLPFLNSGFRGNGALAVPIVMFGNRNYDDALIELRNILEKDGFCIIAAGAFVGEHSFSKILASGRPDFKDLKLAYNFADKIAEKLMMYNNDFKIPVEVSGEEPIRTYYKPRDRKGVFINILKVKPKTNEKCINCGLCSKICPMGSIDKDDPSKVDGICIKCGACIKKCPAEAKYYDDFGYLYHKHELEEEYSMRKEPEMFL